MRLSICLLSVLLSLSPLVFAQGKKPLDHDAYDLWNRTRASNISDNGQWAFLSVGPDEKDTELRIVSLADDRAYAIPRGETIRFTKDSRYIVTLIKAFKDSVKQAKRDKKKPEESPKDSLGIITLATGDIFKAARVKSFKLPKENGGWVAYLLEKEIAKKDSTANKRKKAKTPESEEKGEQKSEQEKQEKTSKPEMKEGQKVKKKEEIKPSETQVKKEQKSPKKEEAKKEDPKDSKKKKRRKAEGTTLVLRNLQTSIETRYNHVISYAFTENGAYLIFAAANKDSTADGIYAIRTSTGDTTAILTGAGDYKKIISDESSRHLAFIANRDSFNAEQKEYALYHWRVGSSDKAKEIARSGTAGIPPNWWVSEHATLSFSKDGNRLFFGTAPRPEEEAEDDTPDDEKVAVDIWNWKDPYLQPMQLKDAKEERERTYRAVFHLKNNKIVQLATETIPNIRLGSEGNADVAVGTSILPYRQLISWDSPAYYDSYLIDIQTGEATRVLTKTQARPILSPESKYIYWWDRVQKSWYVQHVKNLTRINASKNIPHPVHNELHDWPYPPSAHGNAGWTKGDKEFLIYDRYDIWRTDPNGRKAPVNITEGIGRETETHFRYVNLDPEERARDPKADLLLSGFNLKTKAMGYYRDRIESTDKPAELIARDKRFSNLQKAKDADIILFRQSSFEEYPDLWTTDLDFQNARKISEINPQQKDYLWGTAELVEWVSLDGKPLQGILYKPENFDPAQKYPMLVYFYEKMSHQLHAHRSPRVSGGSINFSFYVSRGYLIFIPDIPYKVGFPGESAVNAVVSGVTHLINRGFVNPDRIGVQGHSWGGYQIAYMITRTNIFRAAEAGAPVSNMISAYGGIRWSSGLSRMMQYEKSQSRIGGSLWEVPTRFIENSPIFWADKIQTPLLILHNDNDGAVPWYQGIELFVALRRLDKPAWLVNYNGEAHGIRKHHNRKDWSIRLQQFFDHYLKDAPAPVWMSAGIPAVEKGKTLGLELEE